MKKLELNQMENLEGGTPSCAWGVTAVVLGGLATSTGGLTALGFAAIYAGWGAVVYSCLGK